MSSSTSSSETSTERSAAPWSAVALVLGLTVLPYTALEAWTRCCVLDHVSYTNSEALDHTWSVLDRNREARLISLGDSEVRWGLDPASVDAGLSTKGIEGPTFNMGIDGFSSGLPLAFLESWDLRGQFPRAAIALIGVQMIEGHELLTPERFRGGSMRGDLQRPIFNSPLAKDLALEEFTTRPSWTDSLARALERGSAVFRRRRALRAFLSQRLRQEGRVRFQSSALTPRPDGFHPHTPISNSPEGYEQGWQNFVAQRERYPRSFEPLDPGRWDPLFSPGGYFETWERFCQRRGLLAVFFALPTNPRYIDVTQRREDYQRNSRRLAEWTADRPDSVFIDLGIQDGLKNELHYSDHRHLSQAGAEIFSRALGEALAREALVSEALRRP